MMVELIALHTFADTVSQYEEGQRFKAEHDVAASLIDEGKARPASELARARSATHYVIIASGPSLCDEDLALVQRWRGGGENRFVMVVNTTFKRAPWADCLYAADLNWWLVHIDEVRRIFRGECWTQNKQIATTLGLNHIPVLQGRAGLSRVPGVIHHGGHSGYQAIGLAAQKGAGYITLLAYDLQRTDGRSHHHGDHPAPLKNQSNYGRWLQMFGSLAYSAQRAGIVIRNASRATALTTIERCKIQKALSLEG